MSKRPALHCERLERRELPANSFGLSVLPLDLLHAAPLTAPASLANAFYLLPTHEGDGRALAAQTGGLSSDAVGAFFAKQTSFGDLHAPTPMPTGSDSDAFESLPSLGWDADPSLPVAEARPRVSDAEFWAFLRNYATKAIRREEFSRGPLRDHADIIQQIYVEWREGVSPSDDVHARLLDRDSAERSAFRGAVRRVLDRSRYDEVKQRRNVDVSEHEGPVAARDRDWVDLEIDLTQGIGQLTDREREILDLRRAGLTFEEIGGKLDMPKQRVFEAYTELLDRLGALYRD
jgi:sigma-70-like protein